MKKIERMYDKLSSIKADAEDLAEKLQETYDSHSDAWQESDRGEETLTVIEAMETVVEGLEMATEALEEII